MEGKSLSEKKIKRTQMIIDYDITLDVTYFEVDFKITVKDVKIQGKKIVLNEESLELLIESIIDEEFEYFEEDQFTEL